jgi:hypothetical protein
MERYPASILGPRGSNTSAFFMEIGVFRKHFAPKAVSSRRLCGAVYPVAEKEESPERYIP